MKVVFSQAATSDLRRVRMFLEKENPIAAREAVKAIVKSTSSLETFFDRGSPIDRTMARLLVVRFGRGAYLVEYLVNGEQSQIVIQRIRHSLERR